MLTHIITTVEKTLTPLTNQSINQLLT